MAIFKTTKNGPMEWDLSQCTPVQFIFFDALLNFAAEDADCALGNYEYYEQHGRDTVTPPTQRIYGGFCQYK